MKKRRLGAIFCAMITAICGVATACGHTHTFESEWTSDATHHWKNATCEHSDKVQSKGEHEWSAWQQVIDPTCTEDGEKERVCTVCGEFDIATISHAGHIASEEYYFNRFEHWHVCVEDICWLPIEKQAHTMVGGVCVCGWEEDPYMYWNDCTDIEALSFGLDPNANNLSAFTVYAEELPSGYEGNAKMFYKVEVYNIGARWSVSAVPGMDKTAYEALRGQGVTLTAKMYLEFPDNPSVNPLTMVFRSDAYTDAEWDNWKRYDCGTWHTLTYSLDDLLADWGNVLMPATNETTMMMNAQGDAISGRFDMYWGDFQLLDASGNKILL